MQADHHASSVAVRGSRARFGRAALRLRPLLSWAVLAASVLATPLAADPPKPFPEFTFKMIGVPAPGTKNLITVQIAPTPAPAVAPTDDGATADLINAALAQAATGGDVPGAAYNWYWSKVSPDLTAANSGRLERAVLELSKGPGGAAVRAPRLQDMQDLAATHGRDILMATIGTGVSPALVLAVMGIESGGRVDAVSSAGATGLMQLMPATAARFGVADVTNGAANIKGGVAYLDWLLGEFGQDPVLTLAAYNAGENAVLSHAGVPPFAETRDYVPKVLAAWAVARGLCVTPPELVTDGCVFGVSSAAVPKG